MTAYFLDTECTGKDERREVIELAFLRCPTTTDLAGASNAVALPNWQTCLEDVFEQRYQPTRPSELGALAVHHILPSDLEDMPPSAAAAAMPGDMRYMVGHSIDFDWQAVGSPATVKRICTLAIANHVCQGLDSYSQVALLYHVLGQTGQTRALVQYAHRAKFDVRNNVILLGRLLELAPADVPLDTWEQLWAYSEHCRIPLVMPIGEKQGLKGMPLAECVRADYGFVEWCLRQDWLDPYLEKGLRNAIAEVYGA